MEGVRAVDLERTASGNGYVIATEPGAIFGYGEGQAVDALSVTRALRLAPGEWVMSLSLTASGRGVWLFTNRGQVGTSGDAGFFGDLKKTVLNGPVLDSIPTQSGRGFSMVASDGGIFAFGDAGFVGSIPGVLAAGQKLNRAITGMVHYGTGYLMVGEDGGIFSFSDRPFLGSLGSPPPLRPIVAVAQLG